MSGDHASTIFVAVLVLAGPLLLSWLTQRHSRQTKADDNARLDLVAERAEEAARLLAERQDAAADRAAEAAQALVAANAEVAAVAARAAEVVGDKLDVIHTLVNSSLTAAVQAELDATIRELAMMHEVMELRQAAGKPPSPEREDAVAATEARIVEVRLQLDDRARQQAIANVQVAKAKRDGL
jgi:hypothetical protein